MKVFSGQNGQGNDGSSDRICSDFYYICLCFRDCLFTVIMGSIKKIQNMM